MFAVSIHCTRNLNFSILGGREAAADSAGDVTPYMIDHMIEAERCGYSSHGLSLISKYLQSIAIGEINCEGRPDLYRHEGAVLQFKDNKGFSQYIGRGTVHRDTALGKRSGYCTQKRRHKKVVLYLPDEVWATNAETMDKCGINPAKAAIEQTHAANAQI